MPDIDSVRAQVRHTLRPVRDTLTRQVPGLRPYLQRKPEMVSADELPDTLRAEPLRTPTEHTVDRIMTVVAWVGRHCPDRAARIVEIGSGTGDVLAALVRAGYVHVRGVELNQAAVDKMYQLRPDLKGKVDVTVATAQDVLAALPNDSVDLIICDRAVRHIHPDDTALFDQIARVSSMVLMVEDAPALGRTRYPWKPGDEFNARKLRRSAASPIQFGRKGEYIALFERRSASKELARALPKILAKHARASLVVEVARSSSARKELASAGFRNVKRIVVTEEETSDAGNDIFTDDPVATLEKMGDDSVRILLLLDGLGDHDHGLLDEGARVASTIILADTGTVGWDVDKAMTERQLTERSSTPLPSGGTARVYQRMDKQSTLHDFWRQPSPEGNDPQSYTTQLARSKALHELIKDLPQDARILEVGCNVGRNLAYLYDQGYHNVEGIEINPHAVELLRATYPQLADATVHLGPAGERLPDLDSDAFDLVFTMAVIEHIHPAEAEEVFDGMARVATEVLTIEPENRHTHRQFPHNVQKSFGERGMNKTLTQPMSELNWDHKPGLDEFVANRFKRKSSSRKRSRKGNA